MQIQFHPCCGRRLDRWLKLLVVFDIIFSAIIIQTSVIGLCLITAYKFGWIVNPGFSGSALNLHVATITVLVIFLCIDIMLDVWLWLLVSEKDLLKCRVWFLVKLVLEACDAIGFIVEVCSGQHTAVYIISMCFDTIFTAYILWVLYAFIDQIKKEATKEKLIQFSPETDSTNII